MFLLTVLFCVQFTESNLYCISDCKSCLSGFNYLYMSCLSICPSGFLLTGSECKVDLSQDLFRTDFTKPQVFVSKSIDNFYHPSGNSCKLFFLNLYKIFHYDKILFKYIFI